MLEATARSLASSPAIYLLVSFLAGVVVVVAAARNAWLMRVKSRAHSRDLLAIRARERRLRVAMRESEDGLLHLEPVRQPDGRIVDFVVTESNERAAALFRQPATRIERTLVTQLAHISANSELFAHLTDSLERQTVYRAELRAHPRRTATSWLLVRAVPVDGGLAVSLTDIRDRKREANRLQRASMTDELTGLLNRRGFFARAERELASARAAGLPAVLFYADCDHFKQLNDTQGHQAGDLALREVSRALRDAVRDTDVVARLGGDEFTLLALDASESCVADIRSRLTERIDGLNSSGTLADPLGLSVGHVSIPAGDSATLTELLARADRDLYLHKHSRRAARVAMESPTRSSAAPLARPVTVRRAATRGITTAQAPAGLPEAAFAPSRRLTKAASGS